MSVALSPSGSTTNLSFFSCSPIIIGVGHASSVHHDFNLRLCVSCKYEPVVITVYHAKLKWQYTLMVSIQKLYAITLPNPKRKHTTANGLYYPLYTQGRT